VPRLCGVRLYKEEWGWWLLWLWNAFIFMGSISFMMGYNSGLEAAEYEWPLNILRFVVLGLVGVQVVGTIFQRKERRFYVAMWYTVAALIWTLMNLILGGVVLKYAEQVNGVNSAALHGLYIHYVVGLWLTPAGLAMIYYFLPTSTKNPLYSHRLSLLGFWTLALFYPFVGIHHYLYSPIPHWNQALAIVTSMLLIIPVWAVIVNWFGTVSGRWGTVLGGVDSDSYAAKFLLRGLLPVGMFPRIHGSPPAAPAIDPFQRLRHLPFPPHRVWGHGQLGDWWTLLRLATNYRSEAVEQSARELASVVDDRRIQRHGPRVDRSGIHSGIDVGVWRQLRRYDQGDEPVVGDAVAGRGHDGCRPAPIGDRVFSNGAGRGTASAGQVRCLLA